MLYEWWSSFHIFIPELYVELHSEMNYIVLVVSVLILSLS